MKYRKKPVVIEAYEFTNNVGPDTRPQWLLDAVGRGDVVFRRGCKSLQQTQHLLIRTLEGEMRADIGDFIIRGVKGEIYPCKPDIFAATYEPAEGQEQP